MGHAQCLGCKDDERLLAIDACDLDEEGRPLPRARIEGLSEEAITQAPEVALAWQRRGEALLDCLRHDELDEDQRPMERWYAEARSRFPDGEWAAQIHAQFLESQDRLREADIAWSDAANSDPFDFRNYLGMARVRLALGESAAARVLDQALLLGPHSVAAWILRARLALLQGNPKVARFAAEQGAALPLAIHPAQDGARVRRLFQPEQAKLGLVAAHQQEAGAHRQLFRQEDQGARSQQALQVLFLNDDPTGRHLARREGPAQLRDVGKGPIRDRLFDPCKGQRPAASCPSRVRPG